MSREKAAKLALTSLGFIGAGSMGGALLRCLLETGRADREQLRYFDPDPRRQKELRGLGIAPVRDNSQVLEAQVVILAVKPQRLREVLEEIRERAHPRHLFISIAAGVPLEFLEQALPVSRVVRAMPNVPLMIGAGMTAVAPGSRATPQDLDLALELFRAGGRAEVVEESQMDAITALSGSGPAFVAVFLEAMADGAVKMGLSRDQALEFAAQTLFGSASLILEKNLHPALLKELVTSPGGTTSHGLHALETGAFRAAVISAIEAAAWRARDLAELGR